MFRNCLVAASVAHLAAAQEARQTPCDEGCVDSVKMMLGFGMGGCEGFANCNLDACTDEEKAAKILQIEEMYCLLDGTNKPADPVMVGELDCMVPAGELWKFWDLDENFVPMRNITAEFGNGATSDLITEVTDFCDQCADPLRAKDGKPYQGAKQVVDNMCAAASGEYCISDKGYTDMTLGLNGVAYMDFTTYSYNWDVVCGSSCNQGYMASMMGPSISLFCNENQDGVYCGEFYMETTLDPSNGPYCNYECFATCGWTMAYDASMQGTPTFNASQCPCISECDTSACDANTVAALKEFTDGGCVFDPNPCEECGHFNTTTCSDTCASSVTTSPKAARWGSCVGPYLEQSCRASGPGTAQSFIEDVCLIVDEVFEIEIVRTVMEVVATVSGPKLDDMTLRYMETEFASKVREEVAKANKVAATEIEVSVETIATEIVPAAARRLLANNYTYDLIAKVSDVAGLITATTFSDAQMEEVSKFAGFYAFQYEVSVSAPVATSLEAQQAESDAQMADLEATYTAAGKELPASIKSDLESAFSGVEARSVSAAVLLIVAATALLM